MRLKFFYISLFTVLIAGQQLKAQGWVTPVNLSEHAAAAPNSASLGKYFDYPINFATGLPDIQIPLYTVRSGNITVPIILKYHSGGVGINENASWVGMGWSLEAGGVVSKRVNGMNDNAQSITDASLGPAFTMYNYFNTSDYSDAVNYGGRSMPFTTVTEAVDTTGKVGVDVNSLEAFYVRVAEGKIDAEADDNFFSTPEGGGRIIYNQKTGKYQTEHIGGWLISGNESDYIWDLFNPSGTIRYNYSAVEKIIDPRIAQDRYPGYNLSSLDDFPQYGSAAYLSYISDLQHNKEVDFSYSLAKTHSYSGVSQNVEYKSVFTAWSYFSQTSVMGRRVGTEAILKEISFDQGKVQFVQDTALRKDSGINALKEIRVFDKSNKVIKRIIFDYYYTYADTATLHCFNAAVFLTGGVITYPEYGIFTARLFLNSVQEIDINSSGDTIKNNPYRFTYNSEQALPARFSYGQDHWGYYNGKISNNMLIPDTAFRTVNYPGWSVLPMTGLGANREVDSNYTQTGTLRELYYPTRGKTVFDFQCNRVTGALVGGLRIHRITNYDNVGNISLIKEYSYTDADNVESGITFFNSGDAGNYKYSYTFDPYSSEDFPQPISRFEGQPIGPLYAGQGRSVMYQNVTEKQISSSGNLLSKHYYTPAALEEGMSVHSVPHPKYIYDDNFAGLEYKQEILRKKADNSYEVIQKDSTAFDALNGKKNYIWNVQATLEEPGGSTWLVSPGSTPVAPNEINIPAARNIYKTVFDQAVPVRKFQTSFDGSQSLSQPSFLFYDSLNGNTRVVKTVNSAGDTLIKTAKFAPNYTGSAAQISLMLDKNMITEPVEVANYIKKPSGSALLTGAVFYEYDTLNIRKVYKLYTPYPVSDFTESYISSGSLVHDSRYQLFQEVVSRDENKNPLTVATNTGLESYIWDYSNSTTTAIVKNASISDVAYTSFESDGTGNWDISSGARDSVTAALSGKKSYDLSSGNITSHTMQSDKTYLLSYWSRNGQYTVSHSQSVQQGATFGGWTFYEHKVSGGTSFSISGSGNIDELRLMPSDALMSTTTYDPLVGITTQVDAGNKIIYYEYDGFNRLVLVKDQNRNILKQMCYNYAGQQVNCDGSLTYYNDELYDLFYSHACGTGYAGTAIRYLVPANTYASTISKLDANTQAVNDIAANGQTYADVHGGCIRTYYSHAVSDSLPKSDCDPGYLGTNVFFSLPDSAYSSNLSQDDAETKAHNGLIGSGIINANAHGSCVYTGLIIYAKITVENESGGYGDVVVRFYSDEALTTPYSVSHLSVNYQQNVLNGLSFDYSHNNYSMDCSGTSVTLMAGAPVMTFQFIAGSYVDMYYDYALTDGTPSNAYVIVL